MERISFQTSIGGDQLKHSALYRRANESLIVFLHGFGASNACFEKAFEHERLNEFSLLAIDFVGFGESAKPEDFVCSMENLAKGCDAVLAQIDYENLHIAAHSMGGAVGLLLGESVLRRIRSFANFEGNLVGDDCFLTRKISTLPPEKFEEKMFPKLVAKFSGNAIFQFEKSSPGALHSGAKSLVAWSDSEKLLEKFGGLECKTGYFLGERNREIAAVKRLQATTHIHKIITPISGHAMMTDNPEAFYAQLADFIEDAPES